MNKWLTVAMVMILVLSGCASNRKASEPETKDAAPYTGIVTKVAVLPLKAMDSQSRYIQKILTVRDLDIAFAKHPAYDLLNMDEVADQFKLSGYRDVDDLETEEMTELAEMTKCDVLAMANITTLRSDSYAIAMRLFSARTQELKALNFNVSKFKEERWETLDTALMKEIDGFISTEVDKIFNVATNYYTNANYPEAEKNLKMAMGLNPDLKDAHYYLGATYAKMGKTDDAIRELNLNLEKDKTHQQSLYLLMEIYEQKQQPIQRLEVMEKLATLNEDEEMWLAIGNLYAENKNIGKAEAALGEAIKLDANFAVARSRLAFLLYEESRYADAIPHLEYAFDRYPENDLISRRLAVSYQRTNRVADAIAKYETAIKNNPSNPQPYLSVVSLYRMQASDATDPKQAAEYNAKALDMMNQLVKAQPDNALAYVNLAGIYLAQNNFPQAEANSNLALQKDPSLYLPFVYLSTVAQNKGTADYNRFADLEQQAAKAVGRKANTLKKDRDNARLAANANFRKAADYLNQAKSRATENEAITDINNRLSRVNNLISQSSGY
ncbi:MAG: tetratricopeptide repeat protein [Candidatus Cloacimonetes bacterium]|nr:tetratricopeptide repeat protein [Candidatus Cloacimonadota bacterium]